MIIIMNKEFFVSRRKDEFLVFSSRSLKAIVLSEVEYLVFYELVNNDNELEHTKSQLAKIFSSKSYIPFKDCLNWINSLEKTLVLNGILNNNQESKKDRFNIKYHEKPLKLVAIYLHLTNNCNLRCSYCYNYGYRTKAINNKLFELDDTEILDIVDQAVELGITSFAITGGEPLLRPSCLRIGRYITKEKNCYAELLTNGTLIEKIDIEELLNSYCKIVISLDSHVPEKHDIMRGEGTFEIVVRGINKLCELNPARVILRPVLHKFNVNDFESYITFAFEKFGINQVRSSFCCPRGYNECQTENILMSKEDYLKSLQAYDKIIGESGIDIETEDLCLNKGCGAGSSILSIGACGEVFACQSMHCDDLLAGNTRTATLREIAETSPVLKSIRNITPSKIDDCKDCCLISICGGGCRANAHAIFGSIYCKNTLQCPFDIIKCEYLLWKEADKIRLRAAITP